MRLKDISPDNRPLERLESLGTESLSNAELLAIILKTGTKGNNIIDISNQILSKHSIEKLPHCSITELCLIKGIGRVKASQIKAVFELHKRILNFKNNSKKIISLSQIYKLLKPDLENKSQEHLITIFLNNNELISKKLITIGTSSNTLISQKDILSQALKENANALVIAHNHPSGDCRPSKEDLLATSRLKKSARALDIHLLDHMIFSKDNVYSFRQNNIL